MSGMHRSNDELASGAVLDDLGDCGDVLSGLRPICTRVRAESLTLVLVSAGGLRNQTVKGWDA